MSSESSKDRSPKKKKEKKKTSKRAKRQSDEMVAEGQGDLLGIGSENNNKKKKEKKHKKEKKIRLSEENPLGSREEDHHKIVEVNGSDEKLHKKDKKEKKEKKKKKDKKRKLDADKAKDEEERDIDGNTKKKQKSKHFPFEYQHIVAPMVGASELAFRLLCRKYGATLAYTPMMSASQFVQEAAALKINSKDKNASTIANSNICEFQTIPEDRPLVVHFSANNPQHFAQAAALVEPYCDAVDLNLGCPQRTAFLGHFGSYLLGEEDRELVLDIVRAGSKAVSIPIFVKIRLLDKIEETIKLCHQLRDAGASLIAIHARYRASWERTGPGARDGPALLDQVALVKQSMPDFPIISNGNVITYNDVVSNQQSTGADGIMSAEGILDNPALYIGRLGDPESIGERSITMAEYSPLLNRTESMTSSDGANKKVRKLSKKLRKIEETENKIKRLGEESINEDQRRNLLEKEEILAEIERLENKLPTSEFADSICSKHESQVITIKLKDLFKNADNKVVLAKEYLSLVKRYPMKIRSIVFHTRRMCKQLLEKYQLMEECIACTSIDAVDAVLSKCLQYVEHPETFHYDREKAAREKEALQRKRREEGKRKAYEARMIRKAKREGLADLEHYLRIGAEVPTVEIVQKLKTAPKEERLAVWKKDHSQHCMSYHLDDGGCKRDRACAFLHVEAKGENTFVEGDEVAG